MNFRNRAIARRNDSLSFYVPTIYHSWLRTLSNQIKSYPIFLLAENRELNEMMVVALRKPFQSYQYSTGIYLTWYCQKMPKTPYLWLFMYYLVLLSHFKQQKFEKFLPATQAEKKVYEKDFLEFFIWPWGQQFWIPCKILAMKHIMVKMALKSWKTLSLSQEWMKSNYVIWL